MPFEFDEHLGEFPIERQRFSNWCWAACAVSLSRFYRRPLPIDQPNLVADVLHRDPCRRGIPYPACNVSQALDIPLNFTGHLSEPEIIGSILQNQLVTELSSGTPVGCDIDIPGIGGHAVLIIAVPRNGFLRVADPGDGSILTMSYSQFRNNYRGLGGRWVRTYLTQR